MTVTNPNYLEYLVTYVGRVAAEATLGALYGSIDQNNIKDLIFGFDPEPNGGLGESSITIFTVAPFTPTELAIIDTVTQIPTIWLDSSAETLLVGVPGQNEAILSFWSGQGVTTIDLLLNGVSATFAVGTEEAKAEYICTPSTMGAILLVPDTAQPIFVPVSITVATFAANTVSEAS